MTSDRAVSSYLVNSISLPVNGHDRAADLVGDGRPHNAFGSFLGALKAAPFLLPLDTAEAIAAGLLRYRLDLDSRRAPRALVALKELSPRDLDPFRFAGKIVDRTFFSDDPLSTGLLVHIDLPLRAVGFNSLSVRLPIEAAKISFTLADSDIAGQINGVIKEENVQAILIPALASALADYVNGARDGDSQAHVIIELFQPTRSESDEWLFSPDRLASHPLVETLFALDVQMYDEEGKFRPTPGGARKDSFSIGF